VRSSDVGEQRREKLRQAPPRAPFVHPKFDYFGPQNNASCAHKRFGTINS
jgi:hypothetical protein